MGIPVAFRHLSSKYPSIVVTADKGFDHGYSFDNFYLDMNGIIHPATHPENKPPPETEEMMFIAIFEYIDMLLEMVKPTQILYMAIDGVAPRAKMNQQRSRRFRAAKESVDKKQSIEQIKDELRLKGIEFDESYERPHFDSNVITPGTPFMTNLGKALRDWIDSKMANAADEFCKDANNELRWPKDLIVIFSDASVPGEGEHKIMDFVRKQKAQPDYNPNVRHCLCGADADLIMLGLASHEPDFTILREEFQPNQPKACDICAQFNHETKECQGKANIPEMEKISSSTPFIYIRLCVLREYLEKECDDLDFERFIDDWVLLFFFVGNDFLPHLPSLEIREGAIDKLVRIYKQIMSQYSHPKPYITNNGIVSLHKVQMILQEFGKMENDIFIRRKMNEERFKSRQKTQKMLDHKSMDSKYLAPVPVVKRGEEPEKLENVKEEIINLQKESLAKLNESNQESDNQNTSVTSNSTEDSLNTTNKRKIDESVDEDTAIDKILEVDSENDEGDDVQLWNEGWKERYYLHKFGSQDHTKVSQKAVENYAIGLSWVMLYYYQGCPDWQWYYPYHYAPFASDFKNIANLKFKFNREAKPFRPLEQLMSVFPAASSGSLPQKWQELMKRQDSNIYDFYPVNFKVDLNGKRQAWQGVALLPFIDEDRLFRSLEEVYPELTAAEVERNLLGENLLFISKLDENTSKDLENALRDHKDSKFDCKQFRMHGLSGKLRKSERYTDEVVNAYCLEYFDPEYPKDFIFPAKRLPNAKLPERVLKPEDFKNNRSNYYQNNNRNYQNNHHNNSNSQYYRPVIGFTRNEQQASVGNAGRRMVDFYNRPNYNNSNNLNNNSNRSSSYQSTNYQPSNYQANNYQSSNYQSNNYQPPYNLSNQYLNSQNHQQQMALNYLSQTNYPMLNYPQATNLNANAQEFIPSYNQATSSNQTTNQRNNRYDSRNNSNRSNDRNRRN